MDATITNTTAARIFIPGPNLDLAASGDPDGNDVQDWPDVTVADLDGNSVLKDYVVAGDVTVSVAPDARDAAEAAQGALNFAALPIYAFADLPTGYNGRVAWCSDGRKTGEGAGSGTGVPTYYDVATASWLVFFDDSALAI